MKKLINLLVGLFFIALSVLACNATSIVYLRVPSVDAPALIAKLDGLITITPTTLHYTQPIQPVVSTSTSDVLIPVEDKPEVAALVPELWESRLATMPAEFVPPMPF